MEPRRIYDYRSPHCQPHCTAASDPGYRSLRAFLLVKRQGAMDHLRKPWPHETHARERSRDRRERPDVPHSARPMSLFRIGQSQAKDSSVNYRFNSRERTAFLLPLPLAGEGWGGGSRSESVPWKCPLPDPPPQAGEGTKTESIVRRRVLSATAWPQLRPAR